MRSDIIIPVHNGANFIKKCVESALDVSALTGSSVIVSVNNCSDDTENILSKFNNKTLLEHNIEFIKKQNFKKLTLVIWIH